MLEDLRTPNEVFFRSVSSYKESAIVVLQQSAAKTSWKKKKKKPSLHINPSRVNMKLTAETAGARQ